MNSQELANFLSQFAKEPIPVVICNSEFQTYEVVLQARVEETGTYYDMEKHVFSYGRRVVLESIK